MILVRRRAQARMQSPRFEVPLEAIHAQNLAPDHHRGRSRPVWPFGYRLLAVSNRPAGTLRQPPSIAVR